MFYKFFFWTIFKLKISNFIFSFYKTILFFLLVYNIYFLVGIKSIDDNSIYFLMLIKLKIIYLFNLNTALNLNQWAKNYYFLNFFICFIWFIYCFLIGISVLERVITRSSYFMFSISLYFFIYVYNSILLKKTNLYQFTEESLTGYKFNFFVLIILLYIDYYFYAIYSIHYKLLKKSYFNWYKPYDLWEL